MVERFLNKFIKEAHTLSQLDHSNIIRVLDIFKENNTAYYVMDFIEGSSLEDIVNLRGALSESVAIDYIKQVASALDYIHHHYINHLDVKPANIMIRRSDNKAVLIDFGVSKQYDEQGDQTSTTPVGISHGYAPMEQYTADGVKNFSPQTDIYSLGATLYNLLIGMIPPMPYQVLDGGINIPNNVSQKLADAIRKAMQPNRSKRPTNISAFISLLRIDNNSFNKNVKKQVGIDEEETKVICQENRVVETENELRKRADSIKNEFVKTTNIWMYVWLIIEFLPLIWLFITNDGSFPTKTVIFVFSWGIIGGIFLVLISRFYIKKKSIEWKEQHPYDPVCKYIKTDKFWIVETNL